MDTVCVIYLAAPSESHLPEERLALEQLVDRAIIGEVQLQLTASFDRDLGRLADSEAMAARTAWLAEAPVARRRAAGLFRLDASVLDGPDVLAGDADTAMADALQGLLVSGRALNRVLDDPSSAGKVYSDVDHLIAHWRSGADAFVTIDDKLDRVHRQRLAELGIVVLRPTEAVASSN